MHINGHVWYVVVFMLVLKRVMLVRFVFFVVFSLGFVHIHRALINWN